MLEVKGSVMLRTIMNDAPKALRDAFDENRQAGDHGIVETAYGYHLMYFVENEGLSYRGDIKDTLLAEQYNEYLTGLKKTVTTTYNTKAIGLM